MDYDFKYEHIDEFLLNIWKIFLPKFDQYKKYYKPIDLS